MAASVRKPGANRRPAHANLRREIALGRKAIAGLERAALDELAHMGHDLPRAAPGAMDGAQTPAGSTPRSRIWFGGLWS